MPFSRPVLRRALVGGVVARAPLAFTGTGCCLPSSWALDTARLHLDASRPSPCGGGGGGLGTLPAGAGGA
eukprot:8869338-Heterocapsa_arctica.AAC.1